MIWTSPLPSPSQFCKIPNLPLADVMQPLLTITLCNVHEAFCVIGESVPFSSFWKKVLCLMVLIKLQLICSQVNLLYFHPFFLEWNFQNLQMRCLRRLPSLRFQFPSSKVFFCFVRFLGRMRCIRDSQVFSSEETKLIGYEKPEKETKSNDEKSKKIKF